MVVCARKLCRTERTRTRQPGTAAEKRYHGITAVLHAHLYWIGLGPGDPSRWIS